MVMLYRATVTIVDNPFIGVHTNRMELIPLPGLRTEFTLCSFLLLVMKHMIKEITS